MLSDKQYGVRLLSVGACVPRKVLANKELEAVVDTTDQWIYERTGIRQRHIVSEGETTSSMAVTASKIALERAKQKAEKIDLVLVATTTPDFPMPATAALVAGKLGATRAAAMDVQSVCAGFVYALAVGSQFIQTGAYKNILVVGAEALSTVVDWQDRSTCILFGDGAGACVLTRGKNRSDFSFSLGCSGKEWDKIHIPAGGCRLPASVDTVTKKLHTIHMQGRQVFEFAVRILPLAARKVLKQSKLRLEDVNWLIPHQANQRILENAVKRLGIPGEKVLSNVERYGNTSAASIPIVLDEAYRHGKIKKGHLLLMVAFGAGLSWGACAVRWG